MLRLYILAIKSYQRFSRARIVTRSVFRKISIEQEES